MKYLYLTVLFLMCIFNSNAQFNTIKNNGKQAYSIIEKKNNNIEIEIKEEDIHQEVDKDINTIREDNRKAEKDLQRTKEQRTLNYSFINTERLEGFSIKALYQELLRNNIKHPKIVLAQAILETGWFKSSVCKNKGNLFGLTNPRTGDYYEFNHWKESVVAYRDKVQYKYKDGNYLLWLEKIGYAEDPGYISALIKILNQHLL